MQICWPAWRFQPESVKAGGMWQPAQRPLPSKIACRGGPRRELKCLECGTGSDSWYWCSAASFDVIRSRRVDVREACAGGDGELVRIVEPLVAEVADPVHLEVRDECVPVRHGAPAGVGVEVDPRKAECGRDQHRRRLAVGPEAFPVEEELRVELARAPAREHLVQGRLVHPQEVGERLLVWRQRDDRAHVQVAVRPAVAASADPAGEPFSTTSNAASANVPGKYGTPASTSIAGDPARSPAAHSWSEGGRPSRRRLMPSSVSPCPALLPAGR